MGMRMRSGAAWRRHVMTVESSGLSPACVLACQDGRQMNALCVWMHVVSACT